jgi:hypothetical protein
MKHSKAKLACALLVALCALGTVASVRAQAAQTPPCENAAYRQFDFWVGEWDVFVAGDRPAGRSSIQLILNQCVVFENWTGARGYVGKSFNFYNNQTKKWNQVWVDGAGGNIFFEGEFRDGTLYYTATTLDAQAAKTQHKLTFYNLGPDKVRQLWEQSTDGGKTWNTVFDGEYRRKK